MFENPYFLREEKSETRQSAQGQNDINIQRALWVAIIFTAVAFASFVFSIVLIFLYPVWQVFLLVAIAGLSLAFDILSIVLIRRGQAGMALRILYWSILSALPLNVLLITNVTPILIGLVLTLGFVEVFLLFPPAQRRNLQFGPIVSAIVMGFIEFISPSFRLELGTLPTTGYWGSVMLGFLVLGIIVLAARQFRDFSLRTKMVIGFLALTTLPLIILGWQANSTTTAILEEQARANILNNATSVSADLQSFADSQISAINDQAQLTEILNYMGLSPSQRPGSEEERLVYQYLDTISIQNPTYIESYKLIDLSGIDILDTTRSNIGTSYAGQDFFKSMNETHNPYVSGLIFSPQTGDSSIYFAAPVRSKKEIQIRGIFLVTYNASIIQDLFDQRNKAIQSGASAYQADSRYYFSFAQSINLAQPNATEYTYLIDSTNYFILGHSSRTDLLYKTYLGKDDARVAKLLEQGLMNPGNVDSFVIPEPEIVAILNGMKTTASFRAPSWEYNNEPAQMTAVRVPNTNWIIITARPVSSITDIVQSQTRATVVTGVIIISLAALLVFVVSSLFTRPIIELTRVAANISSGDFTHKADIRTKDEIGTLATTFNKMVTQMRDLVGSLEGRVAERTHSLELAAEVGRSISHVRDLDVMLKDAAEIIRSRFDLYYVQVYLTDPAQNFLRLQAGTGTVGAELVGRGHMLPVDTASINGRAALEKRSVVISDTTASEALSIYLFSHSKNINPDILDNAASEVFRPNPLLPDTLSEMAVPLIVNEKVIGVLDLQNNKANSLNQDMLPGFEALAAQLAIAIQNANLLAETNQARAEVETQARRLTRANWVDYMDAIHQPEETGFVFEQNKIAPMTQAEQTQTANNGNALVAPIAVTGESLGNLVVEMEGQSPIARTDELVDTVARQVAQQIENLRLLDSAERYRFEAEQASRRLTREGWKGFMELNAGEGMSYIYDLKEVRPFNQSRDQQAEGSALSLPLKVRDETVGNLTVLGLEPDNKDALELANAVAERLGTHIESLRQFDQTQSALTQTEKLSVASLRFAQSANLQELLTITHETLEIPVVNRMLLSVFNYSSANELESMDIVANWWDGSGHEPSEIGKHYTIETLNVLPLFISSRPVFSNDTFHDERVNGAALELVTQQNIHSMAVLPLYLGGRQIGVLFLESEETHNFTQSDIRLFTAMAPQIATVLENRRQFERAQKQAERESTLNIISQKIQSATTVEAVLQIAARELGHALGAPMTIAQLSMKDKK